MSKILIAAVAVGGLIATGKIVTSHSNKTTTTVTTEAAVTGQTNTTTVKASTDTVQRTKLKISPRQVIYFDVEVDAPSVNAAIAMINQISDNTVYLVLNTPGGSVLDGARLINAINATSKNVITVCDNLCASMGFQIFEVGKKRLMVDHAILMAHPASGGARGTLENMNSQIAAFKLYVDRMDEAVAKRAGIDYKVFKAMVADNIWAETPEAIALGLADGVVSMEIAPDVADKVTNSVFQYLTKKNNGEEPTTETPGGGGYIFTLPGQ